MKTKVLEPVITGTGITSQPAFNAGVSITDGMADPEPGEVLVVRIDLQGNEIADSAFYIGARTFQAKFAGKPDFVKKKG